MMIVYCEKSRRWFARIQNILGPIGPKEKPETHMRMLAGVKGDDATVRSRAGGLQDSNVKSFYFCQVRSGAGKANMQVMKIAANLHLLDGGAYQSEIDDRHVTAAIGITQDLLEAALGLCHDKGLVGAKAEFTAIIGYLSKKNKGAVLTDIVNAMRGTKPFKDMTSGRPESIKCAVGDMVEQGLLAVVNGVYSIA